MSCICTCSESVGTFILATVHLKEDLYSSCYLLLSNYHNFDGDTKRIWLPPKSDRRSSELRNLETQVLVLPLERVHWLNLPICRTGRTVNFRAVVGQLISNQYMSPCLVQGENLQGEPSLHKIYNRKASTSFTRSLPYEMIHFSCSSAFHFLSYPKILQISCNTVHSVLLALQS